MAANRTAEAPVAVATSSPPAASMHTTTASQADPQSPCRLSMRATLPATIGVGARVMITKTVRLALCILIFRQGRQDLTARQLSGQMEQLGMVS